MRILPVLVAVLPLSAFAVVPANGAPPSAPIITINDSPGQQFDPHVSGDIAAYTDNQPISRIRYYDFVTRADNVIDNAMPGNAYALDLLSDVSNDNIVFTRQFNGTSRIMVFDVTSATISEVDPAPAPLRLGAAIGSNTVAYIDFESGTGDLVTWDLATNTRNVISNSPAFEQNPNVSADGNTVVWEYCPSTLLSCDVYQAVKSGSAWTVGIVAATPDAEGEPDTDGTRVVFSANRPTSVGGQDIYLRNVSGGAETQLEINGTQRNPSIAQGVVGFESIEPGSVNADIFVYLVASNTVLRITDTDSSNETLNDVTVLPNGDIRLVWARNDEDIVATTFTPPGTTTCQNRTVTLDAKKRYCPSRYDDDEASFSPPMKFAIPSELQVVEGNAGNDWATLTITVPDDDDDDDDDGHGHCRHGRHGHRRWWWGWGHGHGGGHHGGGGGWGGGGSNNSTTVTCRYKGGSLYDHPTSPAQIALGKKYKFHSCSGMSGLQAGSTITASKVKLRVNDGDNHYAKTRVKVTLSEVCTTTASYRGSPSSVREDRRTMLAQADTATSTSSLDAAPVPAVGAGCSVSGSGVMLAGLVAVAWALLGAQRRRGLVLVPVRRRRDRR